MVYYLPFYDFNNEIDYLFVRTEKVNAVISFTYNLVNIMMACFHKIHVSELHRCGE